MGVFMRNEQCNAKWHLNLWKPAISQYRQTTATLLPGKQNSTNQVVVTVVVYGNDHCLL
jgi:hypothetical protein